MSFAVLIPKSVKMCIDIVAIAYGGEVILVKLARIRIGQQLPFDVGVLLSQQVFPSVRFA
jgi:hypothetical protein